MRPSFVSLELRGQLWTLFFQSWARSKLIPGLRAVRVTCVVPQTLGLCTSLYSPCGLPSLEPSARETGAFWEAWSLHRQRGDSLLSISLRYLSTRSNTSNHSLCPQIYSVLKWKFIKISESHSWGVNYWLFKEIDGKARFVSVSLWIRLWLCRFHASHHTKKCDQIRCSQLFWRSFVCSVLAILILVFWWYSFF